MLAAVLGTAILVAGIAPAVVLGGHGGQRATVPAAASSPAQAAAIASDFGVQYARFYPRKDDYRDTDTISGTTLVPATVTIRIYTSGGTRIKSFLLGVTDGAYSVAWNGRRKDNSLFAQGTYTVKQFVAAEGTTETATHTVVLSHKRLYWHLGSQTRYADTGAFFTSGNAQATTTSVFSRGVRLYGGTIDGGSAAGRYTFTLPSAAVYLSLRAEAYGKSNFGPGDHEAFGFGYVGIRNVDTDTIDAEMRIDFTTAWYRTSVPAPGHVTSDRKVQAWVTAYEHNQGYVFIQKVKLTYKYALLDY